MSVCMAKAFREPFYLDESDVDGSPSWDAIVRLVRCAAAGNSAELNDWADFVEGCEQLRRDLDS